MAADPKRAKRLDKTLIPPAVTTEYVNAIGMMFSLAALLLRVSGTRYVVQLLTSTIISCPDRFFFFCIWVGEWLS